MKITKTLCDICGKEITYRDREMRIGITPLYSHGDEISPNKGFFEDICQECCDKINETINLLKK